VTGEASLLGPVVMSALPPVVRECICAPQWWLDELQGLHVMNGLNELALPDRLDGYRRVDGAPSRQWPRRGHALVHETTIVHSGVSFFGHSVLGRRVRLGAFFCSAVRNLRRGTVHMMRDGVLADTGEVTIGCVIADETETGVHATIMPGRRIVQTRVVPANAVVTRNC
jgi:hypothetical protein